MKEFIEKLIGRLEELRWKTIFDAQCLFENSMVDKCVKTVKELAEEYNNGWIPCNVRLPSDWENVYATCVSLIDNREPWVIEGIYFSGCGGFERMTPMLEYGDAKVIAWMSKKFPESYQPKGE